MSHGLNLTGRLHRYFAALDIENQLCCLAEQGGEAPAALQALRFERTTLGLRTGYTDHFRAKLCGVEGEVSLSLPHDVVRKLARSLTLPGAVADGVRGAVQAHKAARYDAPAP